MGKKKAKPTATAKGSFLKKNEPLVWAAIILVPICILTIGYLLAPDLIWDDFLFKYYWGPIEADAQGHPINGVTESYNVVDTTTYGIILVLTLFGIYRFLKRLQIEPGKEMFFAAIPYILLGGVMRVLEDAGMFTGKATYLMISPIIYVFIGLVTLLKLVESHHICDYERRLGRSGRNRGLWAFGAVLGFFNILYLVGYSFYTNHRELLSSNTQNVAYMVNPAINALLSLAAFLALLVLIRRRGHLFIHDVFSLFGWHFFALASFQALAFIIEGGKWPGVEVEKAATMNLAQLLYVPLMALGVTAVFAIVTFFLSRKYDWMRIYWTSPVNLTIMFGQLLDAAATFTALQWFNYGEKHVLPNALITITGSPAVMFPLKVLVIAFVIYCIEVELKKDLEKNPLMHCLVHIAILVLGLAPGSRDLLRLAMGV